MGAPAYSFVCVVAEVEVDTETGQVKLSCLVPAEGAVRAGMARSGERRGPSSPERHERGKAAGRTSRRWRPFQVQAWRAVRA